MKLLVGLLKGAVIGAAVGYGAFEVGLGHGAGAWLTYGVVGLLVGLLVGRPLWSLIKDSASTTWVSVLKAAFGFGVGCGLYALIAKVWSPSFDVAGEPWNWPPMLGGAIGAIYGAFVEIDDSVGAAPAAEKPKAALPAGKAKKPAPAAKAD